MKFEINDKVKLSNGFINFLKTKNPHIIYRLITFRVYDKIFDEYCISSLNTKYGYFVYRVIDSCIIHDDKEKICKINSNLAIK